MELSTDVSNARPIQLQLRDRPRGRAVGMGQTLSRILTAAHDQSRSVPRLQYRHERFLRDVDAADALHALFAFFLFLQQLAFAGDVAAVAFGGDVFADGLDRLAGDDFAADRGLQGNLEQVAGDFLPSGGPAAFGRGCSACCDARSRSGHRRGRR